MIVGQEISTGEIVKILAVEDDVEEIFLGRVSMNTGNVLGVNYLTATDKIYKSATVYAVEEEVQPVRYESLMEHYPESTFEDLNWKRVGEGDQWVDLETVNLVDDCSDVWTPEDSEDDTSLSGFIASDSDRTLTPPPNAAEIEDAWSEWEPRSPGGRSFKDTVDYLAKKYGPH